MSVDLTETTTTVPDAATESAASPYRWVICALLFAGLTVNYVDRQILSLLKPMLDDQLHWTNAQFGQINAAFQFAYALSLLGFGGLVDRFGTKLGYALSITAWSLAAAGHALVGSVPGFFLARVSLGLGEGGSFPASIKAIALWFPQRERAFATSLFNAGSNIGALLAPAVVPFVALRLGWHACFLFAAAAGLIWLVFWLVLYRVPVVSSADPSGPASGDATAPSLAVALRYPQAWAFIAGKGLTDPVWWFFLIWLPDYFKQTRHLDLKNSWPHLVTIYAIVTVLSIVGGWVPRQLVRAGLTPNVARKLTMLASACCVVPIVFATSVGDWTAVALIGLAGAAHQSWAANQYSTVSDMFPSGVVGGLVGFGGMAGSLASIVFPILTGYLLDHFAAVGNMTRGYSVLFVACGGAYLVAFAVQHALAPCFERIERFGEMEP